MADGSSQSSVFCDADGESALLVENNPCIVPSMASTTISKLSAEVDQEESDRENHEPIFAVLKEGVVEGSQDDGMHTPDEEVQNTSASSQATKVVANHHRMSINSPARVPKWSLETMATAMDSVLAGELTTTMAARKFQIPRTTLLDRLSMRVKVQYLDVPGSFPLSPENDALLVEFVKENQTLDKHSLIKGLIAQAEDLAAQQGKPFANPLMSRKWLKLFVHKHPNLDILRTASKPRTSYHSTNNNNNGHQNNFNSAQQRTTSVDLSNVDISHEYVLASPSAGSDDNDSKQNIYSIQRKQQQELEDSFETNLAKQGLDSIERKLTQEQQLYFKYRFYNNTLEKGYHLWCMCKAKADDSESFESILSNQALTGMETALDAEHLKYFLYRYENTILEEGYKLWAVLKDKCQ